ncbi:hypothetical protein [Limosilactobacillus panis]|uniref:Uncharacterized protein n=1 Tax=Limosilactobacillus panis TaxID=47493 RepID=A0ABT7VP26_9LACO|nr:hypothetical protein [Limosilactobacillus panis]MDM8334484.1 hypothetical protein [Limosilactobacillus panis]
MSRSVFRKTSIKKSLAAKYKGAYKRKIKKALIPGYGTRAAGWAHPKKKLYNKIYNKTSYDTRKLFGYKEGPQKRQQHDIDDQTEPANNVVASFFYLVYDLMTAIKTISGSLGVLLFLFLPTVSGWCIAVWLILWILRPLVRSVANIINAF